MKNFSEKPDLVFEMNCRDIENLIERSEKEKLLLNSHDVSRIHAHVSPSGGNCKECHQKLINAKIIEDFNEGIED